MTPCVRFSENGVVYDTQSNFGILHNKQAVLNFPRRRALLTPSAFCAPRRFRKQIGEDFGFGSYVATVSRLNLLWTLACGVVEIVHMMQRRRNLMEVRTVSGIKG